MSTESQRKIDVVDRVKTGWIINLILNHKTQEDIAKDIADGVLDLEEIEEMFPWRYVQELRRGYAEPTQNYLHRFTEMSDDRMKVILDKFLRQKSRNEIIKLISDHALKLDKLQVSYLWKYVTGSKEDVDSEATSSTSCFMNSPNKDIIVESKASSSTGTKRKQATKKSDKKETKKSEKKETKKSDEEERKKSDKKETKKSQKKEAKKSDEEEKEKKVEKTKKVRIATKKVTDKSKNVKRVDGTVDDGNKVEEAIEENNSAKEDHGNVEKASIDPDVSTNQGSHQEGLEELSVTGQEDRSKDEKSTGAKQKIIKKVSKKDTKASMEKINEGDSKEMNFPIEGISSTNEEQRVEEINKSENNENVIEKEEASFAGTNGSYISLEMRNDERFEDSSQKSRSNETINVSSLIGEELEICSNQNQENRDVEEYDLDIQFDTSTPKKLDNDGNIIQIKTETEDERFFNEIDTSINNDLEKDADLEKNFNKKSQVTDDEEEVSNVRNRLKSVVIKVEKNTRSPKIPKRVKHDSRKKEAEGKVKQSKYRKQNDRSVERQRQSRHKRMKEEELRKCEKKIRNTMEGLKDQINKLVKDIRYLGEENRSSSTDDSSEKESSSSSNDYTSEEESSCSSDDYYTTEEESSYDISSECSSKFSLPSSEECYCPSCVSSNSDSSTDSDSNSEYTICSCSTHYNSTDSNP
ncbi:titin isoform X1 [Vespula squamosa]|uniref:Titin isoform X1 n=1 Tax=Vespula squamosa TaxID=30214 RepID=A0ABD2AVY5_VESSQ